MPIVTMPDGQQVDMPDDPTPELGNRLRAFLNSSAPVKTPMMASHGQQTQPPQQSNMSQDAVQYLFGSEAHPSMVPSDIKSAYANMGEGFYNQIGDTLQYVGKRYNDLMQAAGSYIPSLSIARTVAKEINPFGDTEKTALNIANRLGSGAKNIAEQYKQLAPVGYQKGVLGQVETMAPSILASKASPQVAAGLFGTGMGNQAEEAARAIGASPATQKAMGVAGSISGGIFGAFGVGGEAGGIAPTVGERLASSAKSANILGGITTGMNALEKVLYNPDKNILEGVPTSMLTGAIIGGLEAKGTPITEDRATALARFAKENPTEFSKHYRDVLGPPIRSFIERVTPDGGDLEAQAKAAYLAGDHNKALEIQRQIKSTVSETRPAFREATPEEAAATGKYDPLKLVPEDEAALTDTMAKRGEVNITEPTKPFEVPDQPPIAPEDASRLADLHQQRMDNEASLDSASRMASKTGSKKAQAEVDSLTQNQGQIENEIAKIQLGIKEPETKHAFREATPEESAVAGKYEPLKLSPEDRAALSERMGQRGEASVTEPTKPFEVPEQAPIALEDASRLADLHKQRMDNETALDVASRRVSKTGSKKAQAEVDNLTQNQSQIENEIAKIQLGIKGPSDVPVPEPPNPEATPAETNGLTPQGSGTSLLSNEEIMRSQRGDTYYRVDRSGSVTNLGPQPDAPVRNGEAIIMVDGETGKPQVQNSQGLGNDKVVLNKFGNRVMGVHEAGHGMIADNLGLQQLYEAGMNKAKDVLGLDRASTDGDVVRAFADKLGKLGKTAKETTVKIMNQVKGIGRDLAGAIADHLHQMVSGSRESQLGAIGPDIKAKYTEEQIASAREAQERHRARIKSAYDDPQDRARMYKQIPSVETILGKDLREEVRPVEQKAQRSVVQAVSTALRESVSEPARAIKDIWTWGGENPVVKFFNEADQRGMIQHAYEKGSGELAPLANSMITGEAPKVVKDLDYGTTTNLKKFFVSPHIIEDGVFPTGEGPTIDAQKAATHVVMMRGEATRFFQDILHPFGDNSAELAKQISPLFKQFRKFAEQFYPLDIQQRQLMDAMKSKDAKKAGEAKVANQQWMEQNGAKYDALNTTIKKILDHRNRMIEGFAEKYADARIYLAAEGKPVAGLTGSERKAANSYKQAMQAYKAKLDAAKIPTIDDDYVPHLVRQLDPEAFQVSAISGVEKKVPEILKFAERMEDSKAWLPSAYGAASIYVPTASRKLAMQPILDKWRPMIDPNNLNGYTNPGSPNYAPNAGAYVEGMIGNMLKPRETNLVVKIVDALKAYETFRLLAFNPRTGYKHLFKLANMLGEHHVWLGPGGKDIVQARIANTPVLKGLVDNLGLTDWRAKAQLVHQFYGTREILGMLQENPFISGLSDPLESKIAGSRAAKAVGNTRLFLKNVIAQPVKSVEAFENGLNILSSIEKGRNLPFEKSMNGMILNILDYNFRGGADAAEYLKNPSSRWATMFTQTPQKLAELHAKIVRRGLAGQRDIFGSEDSAKMVRHVIALGAVAGMSAMQGINWADSMLHVAGVNTDFLKHSGKMMFYKAMAGATGKEDYSDKALENELLLLGDRGLISVSPFFGLKDEIDTLVGGGPSAWVNSMPGVKQIKAGIKGQAPIGYSTPGRYMTGTQSEEEKKAMEAWRTKRGLREKKTIMRKSAAND